MFKNCLIFSILFWYLPPWQDVLLAVVGIASFPIVLVCDRYCGGEVGVMTDKTLVCAPS